MKRPFSVDDPTTWTDMRCEACGHQTRWRWCRSCNGDGFSGDWEDCRACDGAGGVWHCKHCAAVAAELHRRQNPTLPGLEALVRR